MGESRDDDPAKNSFGEHPLKQRQIDFLNAITKAGFTSPISRADLVTVCEDTSIYSCPPSWITNDSSRKVGRGLYDLPELKSASPKEAKAPAPAPASAAPVADAVVQGAVEPALTTADLMMGMTGGERDTLVPSRFNGYVAWGHFSDVEKIVRSRKNYNVFITGLSGNGKTLMVEQVCAKLKRECYRVNITRQTDEDDLLGGFRLINGNTVWCDGPVVSAMKNGGILLLDEIDLGSANMMCLQPVLEGKGIFLKKIGKWVTPTPGFTVFATANTKGKGSDDGRFVGTGIMNEAMLDRFPVTLEQPYASKGTEKKILSKAGLDDAGFADHLTAWADMIRKAFYAGAVDEVVSTRRLVDIVNAFAIFGNKDKAIAMCLARFDEDTKEAFMSLYGKVDAEFNAKQSDETIAAEGGENNSEGDNKCPF
jgi:MoxR-like ATPase